MFSKRLYASLSIMGAQLGAPPYIPQYDSDVMFGGLQLWLLDADGWKSLRRYTISPRLCTEPIFVCVFIRLITRSLVLWPGVSQTLVLCQLPIQTLVLCQVPIQTLVLYQIPTQPLVFCQIPTQTLVLCQIPAQTLVLWQIRMYIHLFHSKPRVWFSSQDIWYYSGSGYLREII